MLLPITTFYLSIMGLLIMFLAINVVKYRRTEKVGIGDGGNRKMEVAVRAHSNAIENVVVTILLLAALELNKANPWLVHSFGIALVVSRLLHAQGFYKTQGKLSFGRFYGIILNWLAIIALCIANLVMVIPGAFQM